MIFILTRTYGFSTYILLLWEVAMERLERGKFKGKSKDNATHEARTVVHSGC